MSNTDTHRTFEVRWPDPDSTLAAILPVIVRHGSTQQVVAPGSQFATDLVTDAILVAVPIPGGRPMAVRLDLNKEETIIVPFRADSVLCSSHRDRSTETPAVSKLNFRLEPWTEYPTRRESASSAEWVLRLNGNELRVAPAKGERTGSVGLVLEAPTVPTRILGIPQLGPDESVIVDLTYARPFGTRPTLIASDVRTRLLLAYLSVGEFRFARTLASRLAPTLAEYRQLAWSEPSLAQLAIGYSLALVGDAYGLDAWCRRTCAAHLLGVDGLVLQAQAASLVGEHHKARTCLVGAARLGSPVLSVGADLAIRLAFRIVRSDQRLTPGQNEGLDRLIAKYSALASMSDGLADTIIRTPDPRLPITLDGASRITRAGWRIRHVFSRFKLTHEISESSYLRAFIDQSIEIGSRRHNQRKGVGMISEVAQNDTEEGTLARNRRNMISRHFSLIFISLITWLLTIGGLVWASLGSGYWMLILVPLCAISSGMFLLVGFELANYRTGDLLQRTNELLDQVRASERRARRMEEEAMRGRALASVLQAEAQDPGVSYDGTRHARVSESLFGRLVTSSELNPE